MFKKVLIYNPYFATLGGGEYFSCQIGLFFWQKNFKVEIAWKDGKIITLLEKRFNLKLKGKIEVNKKAFTIIKQKGNLWQKYQFEKKYDLLFFVSDGSIPWLFAKENWLLFQAPFINVNGKSFLNQLKLKKIDKLICYSYYVKKFLDREFKVNSLVVYPPLSGDFYFLAKKKKENIILSIGRFDEKLNDKNHGLMIEVFKKLVKKGLKNWKLVLIGGLLRKNKSFEKLEKSKEDYPIKIITNCSFKKLLSYLQKAKIYWSATGYNQNLENYPQKAEHFGLAVAQAILADVLPLVYDAGGPLEIIGNKYKKSLFWREEEELLKKTQYFLKKPLVRQKILKELRLRMNLFNEKNFCLKLNQLYGKKD